LGKEPIVTQTLSTPSSPQARPALRRLWWACALVLLSACGGGGSGDSATATAADESIRAKALRVAPGVAATVATDEAPGVALGVALALPPNARALDRPASRFEAARFLTQATFGPNDFEIELLMKIGYSAWIDRQLRMPATSHRAWWEAADAAAKRIDPNDSAGQSELWESFWNQALNGPDQLRQRMAFALSQIFVISAVDGNIGDQPRALAAWLDMLGEKGFGNYRDLLETVSLHPLMGLYLTHLKNQKPDPVTGRIPDQNYARESMQLLSIGLVKLKSDGTPLLDGNGRAIETYGPPDVAGLSNVFTGFSWACPAAPASNNCFSRGSSNNVSDPDRYFKPMVAYPQFHSTDAKSFLGVTIPASATPNPLGDLKIALDTLSAHPNVAPFISKQLIQRLVTSNPSGPYVQAVAAVFDNNGAGQRGDLKAVLKAILLHPEAKLQTNTTGKVREPVLRLSAYLRAFPHKSDTGSWKVGSTDSVSGSLGQTPLRAPSVFNFYRPGYSAPGSQSAAAGMVGPELQLLNESSAAGWVNFMRDNLSNGVGQYNGTVGTVVFNRRDLQRDWSAEMAMATQPADLVASVTGKLLYGLATPALRTDIQTAISKITIPVLNAGGTNQGAIDTAKRNRVNATVLLTLAVPEFVVQK
jgi:uncharacterized protein (DUF1800 family)